LLALLPGFSAAFLMFRPRFFKAVICKVQHRKHRESVALHAAARARRVCWLNHSSHVHRTFSCSQTLHASLSKGCQLVLYHVLWNTSCNDRLSCVPYPAARPACHRTPQ
jgi:hypothetical protein